MFCCLLISVDTHHGNLLKSLVTVSKATGFIPRGQAETSVAKTNAVKTQGEDLGEEEKRKVTGQEKENQDKGEIPGSG